MVSEKTQKELLQFSQNLCFHGVSHKFDNTHRFKPKKLVSSPN